jgi:peptidoglycan-associated lipoprotein
MGNDTGNRRIHGPWLAAIAALALLLTACPDKKPDDTKCKGDADCKDGLHCVNQQCLTCGEDSHCPDGQKCQNGACLVVEPACTTDEQCPDGQACIDGACKACTSNDQCGPGGKCNAGECERAKACSEDTDCADDEDCIEGRCQKPWESTPPELTCKLETVYFDFDQAAIRADAREVLAANADCVRQAPANRVVNVEGHTDQEGTEEYNIALSERRARTVADYLARLGIDPARFQVVAKGEGEPAGAGDDKDRRVDFQWQ